MSLPDAIRESFVRSIALYDELIATLREPALAMELPGIRSNAIGGQLWCVVGARESYARAIRSGAWSGFSSSLTRAGTRDKAAVAHALRTSGEAVLACLEDLDMDDGARARFVVDLLEHEAAHHGQLIRYLYGLDLPIPAQWKAKYALD